MTAKTYVALRNLQHDGKAYAIGGQIPLTDDFANALLAVGAVRELADNEVATDQKPKAKSPSKSDTAGTDTTVTAVADGAK